MFSFGCPYYNENGLETERSNDRNREK
ncbi:MAG: hypothetical protein K0R47_5999, partial [Brevibacillus sp.]|nr:hypothetical protein [Brevibacillus sp.]